MIYVLIAVLAVLAAMIGFMLLVLRQMGHAAGQQIEKDAGRLFGLYDELLEEKSRQLKELYEEEAALKERMERLAQTGSRGEGREARLPAPLLCQPAFHDEEFSHHYNQVRTLFSMDKKAFVLDFKKQLPAPEDNEKKTHNLLLNIRSLLGFESLYRLSILPPSSLQEILEEVLTEEQAGIYHNWREENPEGTVSDFSDWLDYRLSLTGDTLTVKVSPSWFEENGAHSLNTEGICWMPDPSVCEGLRLLYRGYLYDYSI